ncbi:MAG: UPF0182 family protein, partial [Micromonosporaceae bacterium]
MVMKNPLPQVSRRGRVAVSVAVILVALYILLSWGVRVRTDWLWYSEVGYTEVFGKQLTTRLMLFGLFGGLVGLWTAGNLYLAYRLRPVLRPNSPEQLNLDRYRMRVTPRIGLYITLVSAFVGLIAGLSAQGRWQQWLLFWNAREFGRKDSQFHLDIGFYVFEYPFWRFLLGMAFTGVVIGVLGALFLHYLYGGVRLQGAGDRMSTAARAHLSGLVGLFVILKAIAYFLDRYGLVLGYNNAVETAGAGYTDINALLPAKEILVWISVIAAVAVLVFSNAFARNLVWPGMALALVVVSAIAIGGVYPWGVQTFEVNPNLVDKEAPYISRAITATRHAYGLQDVARDPYAADNVTPPADLAGNSETADSVRLLDPSIVADTYTQLQQVRGFYDFNDTLDVDRYETPDGKASDYVVGVRELNSDRLTGSQTNWLNKHTVFTHGYGFVAAPANDPCGSQPRFVSGFLAESSTDGDSQAAKCSSPSPIFDVKRPQIYYGELLKDYSVVGKSAKGSADREFDRPTAAGEKGEQVNTTYQGKGGVPVGSYLRRLMYGWQYGEVNFLLSERFNENSKLLYVRNPRDRVEKAAPFLTVDGDPYPAVVNGRIKWIVDGYTTASTYPYSDSVNLQEAASDALTGRGTAVQAGKEINYIRNSVKATVDAYDGSVKLYEWDKQDPVLKAWDQAFGGDVVEPKSSIPEDLAQHFRYPEDLFKVQRDLLVSYHVSDPKEFFSADDFWKVPEDPIDPDSGESQPPFYLLANLSEKRQGDPTFQLTTAVTPQGRQNLAALISGYYDKGKP